MMLVTAMLSVLCLSAHSASLLKKDSENVRVRRLSTHYDRLRRSEGCEFPLLLRFQFDVNDVHILLNLERNNHIQNNVPIYVPGEDGEAVREDLTDDLKFALYQDMNQGSAMLVSCDEDETYKLQGSFRYDDVLYHMTPSNQPVVSTDHTILQTHRDNVTYELDAIQTPETERNRTYSSMNSTSRTKRTVSVGNVIELVFAVDASTYQYYLNEQGTKAAAERAIRRHVTMLANEADIYYTTIPSIDATVDIRIFVSGIFIDDNSGRSDWSSKHHVTINGKGYLSYEGLIYSVRNWRRDMRGLPAHDHLMALSLLEFAVIRSGAAVKKGLTGVAYIGTLCSKPSWSVSFTQLEFNGRTAQTIAHELGHSISAEHDGQGNYCSRWKNNVMTPVFTITTSSRYAASQWTFSTCSVDYFKNHLNSLAPGTHCMLEHSFNDVDYWLDTYGLPGDYYTINEQCALYQGIGSTTCDNLDFVTESSCYRGFHCSDYMNGCLGSYYALYPLTGTKCGNSSGITVCYKGQCTTRTPATSTKSNTSSTSTSTTSSKPATNQSSSSSSRSSTTSSATTTTTSTTTTTIAVCTKKKCCKQVEVGTRTKRKCCKGISCCKPNRKWSSDTECYIRCCTSKSTATNK